MDSPFVMLDRTTNVTHSFFSLLSLGCLSGEKKEATKPIDGRQYWLSFPALPDTLRLRKNISALAKGSFYYICPRLPNKPRRRKKFLDSTERETEKNSLGLWKLASHERNKRPKKVFPPKLLYSKSRKRGQQESFIVRILK